MEDLVFEHESRGHALLGVHARSDDHEYPISVPLDVVAGSGDLLVKTASQSGRLANALGATFHSVEGAGHMVHHTAPERLLAAIKANIAKSASAATVSPESAPTA